VRLYCLALLGFHGCQVGELVLPITSCLFVYFAGAGHGGPLSLGVPRHVPAVPNG
jgi:hypothetical protein